MKVTAFLWDDDNVAHIQAHGVTQSEVEQVLRRSPKVRRTRDGLYQALGGTQAGRYLAVFFRYFGRGIVRLITPRDMTQKERRTYGRK